MRRQANFDTVISAQLHRRVELVIDPAAASGWGLKIPQGPRRTAENRRAWRGVPLSALLRCSSENPTLPAADVPAAADPIALPVHEQYCYQ